MSTTQMPIKRVAGVALLSLLATAPVVAQLRVDSRPSTMGFAPAEVWHGKQPVPASSAQTERSFTPATIWYGGPASASAEAKKSSTLRRELPNERRHSDAPTPPATKSVLLSDAAAARELLVKAQALADRGDILAAQKLAEQAGQFLAPSQKTANDKSLESLERLLTTLAQRMDAPAHGPNVATDQPSIDRSSMEIAPNHVAPASANGTFGAPRQIVVNNQAAPIRTQVYRGMAAPTDNSPPPADPAPQPEGVRPPLAMQPPATTNSYQPHVAHYEPRIADRLDTMLQVLDQVRTSQDRVAVRQAIQPLAQNQFGPEGRESITAGQPTLADSDRDTTQVTLNFDMGDYMPGGRANPHHGRVANSSLEIEETQGYGARGPGGRSPGMLARGPDGQPDTLADPTADRGPAAINPVVYFLGGLMFGCAAIALCLIPLNRIASSARAGSWANAIATSAHPTSEPQVSIDVPPASPASDPIPEAARDTSTSLAQVEPSPSTNDDPQRSAVVPNYGLPTSIKPQEPTFVTKPPPSKKSGTAGSTDPLIDGIFNENLRLRSELANPKSA